MLPGTGLGSQNPGTSLDLPRSQAGRPPLSEGSMVGVAGFEPALCLVPNEVPYQARRHSDESELRQVGSRDVMGAPAHCTEKGGRTPGVNVVPLSFAVVPARGLEPLHQEAPESKPGASTVPPYWRRGRG